MEDPFAVLGLGCLATAEEVHAAYRMRAKACHPDLHRTNEEAAQAEMIRLNVAYAEAVKQIEKRGAGGYVLPDAFKAAQRLYSRGQLGSALRMLTRAPQRDAEWYGLRGEILLKLDKAEEAHASYRAAVRLCPNERKYRAGALEAAVRMRKEQTALGKMARFARQMTHPLRAVRGR